MSVWLAHKARLQLAWKQLQAGKGGVDKLQAALALGHALCLAGRGFELLPEVISAQKSLEAVRFRGTLLLLNREEQQVIQAGIAVCDAQLDSCTEEQLIEVLAWLSM